MMGKCRLYIADIDERFVASVRDMVARRTDLELVGNSGNGKVALSEILRLLPDVVLADIPLPELDGIALLHELRRIRRPPAVIICTRFYSQASMSIACRYGAAFFLCKPVDLQALPPLICECADVAGPYAVQALPDDSGEAQAHRASIARELLKRFGLSPRLDGSAYILETVLHCRDDMLLRNLSRGLYTELANRMNTTVPRVERSLRSAIQIAYERGTLSEVFPTKPTNRQFITHMLRAVDDAERSMGE